MQPDPLSSEIPTSPSFVVQTPPKPKDRYVLHVVLFLLTLASTIWAGADLATGEQLIPFTITNWSAWLSMGLIYALSLLGFLTVHEFGHYFAARYHGISTTLPYFVPAPLFFIFNIGTFGAVIKIREAVPDSRTLFDIGVAGPIAGFVVSVFLLLYGLWTLPGPEFLLGLPGHEDIKAFIMEFGRYPGPGELAIQPGTLYIGQTPLFLLLSSMFPNVPPMYELYHYPMLFAAWLGLFFTALNLLPVGQLDGGHVWYTLVGAKWHGRIARGFVMLLLASGSLGYATEIVPAFATSPLNGILVWTVLAAILLYFLHRMFDGELSRIGPALVGLVALASSARFLGEWAWQFGYTGWFLWCILIVVFIQVDHPPVENPHPLSTGRKLTALASVVIFLLCFSITPLFVV